MEVESERSFNDENYIANVRDSDEESEMDQIKRKKFYPQCIINSEGENSEAIKQEPQCVDLSESCLSRNNTMNSPEICPEMGTNVSDMVQNLLQSRHPGMSPLQCSECDLECPSLSALEFHTKLHVMERIVQSSYEYPGVGLKKPLNKVNRQNGMRKEVFTHKSNALENCNAKNKTLNQQNVSKEKNNTHIDEARDIETIMESLVSQEPSEETSYSDSGYTGDRPHKCDVCGFRFTSTTHLKRHMRTHTGDKPYACTECDYRCARTDKLKIHMQSHNTGQKPFACKECDYSSVRKDKLKDHMKTHVTGLKQYSSMDFTSDVANISSNGANNPGAGREIYKESDIPITEETHIEKLTHTDAPTNEDIKMHKIEPDERPFKCKECDSRFKAKNNLKEHMLTHLTSKSFSCTHCEYTCSRKAQLTRHMLTHTGEKRHGCPLCDYRCNEKGNLAKHLVIHGDDKPFSCPEEDCNYKCKLKCNLKTHMLKHSGEKPYACHLCDYRSLAKGGLTTHMFKHSGEKPFLCSICGNRYALKGDLNVHMRIHTNNKKFKCEQCDYRCFTQQRIDQHMLTHTGEKPHKCDECGFRFTSTSHLKRHMRTHTGDKPYVCTECDYRSARNDKLKIHMQAHIGGQKPYACTECDYSTVRNDKLKDHMQTHNTGQKLYPCTECDYSASRNDYLKSHMKTHITGKLEQLKQSKPSNDLTINETISSLTKSNFISQKPNEGSSSTGATTGDNPVGSHGIFGSLSVRSSQLPNDLPHHSEVSNDSSQAHQTFHQGNAQSLNNQHIIGANSIMGRSIQETTHQDVNYKMYSNNMEYHSLSKRYSNFPPSAKPLWHQGSSSIPAVNTDGYNYQVLSDKLLYTRKVNTHAGENLAHISQNYSHNPLAPYPRPMFIDSSMPGPPNMSEMIRHATDLYNNQ